MVAFNAMTEEEKHPAAKKEQSSPDPLGEEQ
jgi:hypothetical protein